MKIGAGKKYSLLKGIN